MAEHMTIIRDTMRLARLYGWCPIRDQRDMERYLNCQLRLDGLDSNVLTESRNPTGAWAVSPHVLPSDLQTFASALQGSLPDIPDYFVEGCVGSLFEVFAGEGKDWLRDFIVFCRVLARRARV